MPSSFGTTSDKDGNPVNYFHDDSDCLPGREHDWSGWRDNGDGSSERVCANCGMGAIHHSMMTADGAPGPLGRCACGSGIYTRVDDEVPKFCRRCRDHEKVKEMLDLETGRGNEVLDMYDEPHRHYHTTAHLHKMLSTAKARGIVLGDEQVVAVWFHDCVYRVPADPDESNEDASAKVAVEFMREAGLSERFIWTVESIILATQDHVPRLQVSREVIDLDLWELATEDFQTNAPLIRMEFEHLSEEQWREGRVKWIRSMLGRERIFVSEHATEEMEAAARRNLTLALEQLEMGHPGGIRGLLEEHDHPDLECDGATRVFSWLLKREKVGHTVMGGRLEVDGAGVVEPHYWILLDDGRIIDYKARRWLPDAEGVPHGIFELNDYPKALYVGEEAKGFLVTRTMFNILTRTPAL